MVDFSKIYNLFYFNKNKIFKKQLNIFKYTHIRIYSIAIISLNILTWVFANHININSSQDLVVLHYNVNFGVDLIGSVKKLYIIPILGLIFFAVNLAVSLTLIKHKNFRFISHILFGAIITAHIFLLISLASIYLINFR